MDERRKNDRIDAHDAGLQVSNTLDGSPLGIIGNLSPGGMMLISNRELFADGVLQLTIQAPAESGCEPIGMGVKILWSVPANSPNEYWAGLEAIDIDAGSRDALQQLLDYLGSGR